MRDTWYPGITAFCSHWKHAPMLQQTFETFEAEFEAGNDACIDAAKAMIECACRVLIDELDVPHKPIKGWADSPIKSERPSVSQWVAAVVKLLELSEKRDDPFNKVISQHYKLTEALGKFRDLAGTVSHGKNGFIEKLSAYHRRSAVLAADVIITFLHEAYLANERDPTYSLEPISRFEKVNQKIDAHCVLSAETNEDGGLLVTVHMPDDDEVTMDLAPSQLLFSIDRQAYKFAHDVCKELPVGDTEEDGEGVTA